MATTFSWTKSDGYMETVTLVMSSVSGSYTVTGNTISYNIPSATVKYNSSYLGQPSRFRVQYQVGSGDYDSSAWTGYVNKNVNATVSATAFSRSTSSYFSSSNPTAKTVTIKHQLTTNQWGYVEIEQKNAFNVGSYPNSNLTVYTATVTLNAPPTFYSTPTLSKNTADYYTVLTELTATVPVRSSSAKYGGYISKIVFNVGTQSVTKTYTSSTAPTSNQTLNLTLANAGTNIPVSVTMTDSRGQTVTHNFSAITVTQYDVPSVNFDVYRTDNTGTKDDEGTYGLIEATIGFTSSLATLTQPAVVIKDASDQTVTPASITWYSTAPPYDANSTPISDWSTITYSGTTPPTVYGLIDGSFNKEQSYSITMTETDSLGESSDPITQTLSTAYYTIDFQAGGKEIAFGAPANDDLTNYNGNDWSGDGVFKCAMHTDFIKDVNAPNIQQIQSVVNGIGTRYYNSTSKTISSAGIDNTPVQGGTVTLPRGHIYVIVGQWAFNTGSGTTARNNQVIIKDITNNTNKATQRIYNYNASFCVMQVSYITEVLSADTKYAVCASSSMTYTTASNNQILAICIK